MCKSYPCFVCEELCVPIWDHTHLCMYLQLRTQSSGVFLCFPLFVVKSLFVHSYYSKLEVKQHYAYFEFFFCLSVDLDCWRILPHPSVYSWDLHVSPDCFTGSVSWYKAFHKFLSTFQWATTAWTSGLCQLPSYVLGEQDCGLIMLSIWLVQRIDGD